MSDVMVSKNVAKNSVQLETGNRHTSETDNDRHHHQLLIQPPDQAQNRSIPLSYQQNAVTPTNRRKTTNRMGNNTNHSAEQ